MNEDTNKFKNYVRSTAFSMSLSYNQIMSLFQLVEDDKFGYGRNGNFVQGVIGLGNRGLVEHRNYPEWAEKKAEYTGMVSGKRPAYIVTAAGKKMYELLKIAGF